MKEFKLQGRADQSEIRHDFDVTKHDKLVPPFQEKEINSSCILRKLQKI